jgi:hypothetical protein
MRKLSLKITHSAKPLFSFSGLHLFDDLFHKFEIQQLIAPYLPKKLVYSVRPLEPTWQGTSRRL